MNGLDQIVIAMWFLPVALFIVMPLCIGAVWLTISLIMRLVHREAFHYRQTEPAPK